MKQLVWSDFWSGYIEVDMKDRLEDIPDDAKFKWSNINGNKTTDIYVGDGYKYYGIEWLD